MPRTPPPAPGGSESSTPLDYRGKDPAAAGATTGPRPITDVRLTVTLLLFAAALTGLVLVVVPRSEAVYRDFGTKLPMATVVLLRASRLFADTYAWIAFWAFALAIPVLVARLKPWPSRPSIMPLLVRLSVLVLGVILVGFAIVALVVPYLTLIDSVAGQGPKK